jgi:hypothetical protein
MLDFAKWAEAGCRALGVRVGAFEDAYRQNRSNASMDALDADLVGAALILFMAKNPEYEGTATDLLLRLEQYNSRAQSDRWWPKDATRLSSCLRRLAPLLRLRGITIDFDERTPDIRRDRLIKIKRVEPK